MIADDGSDDLHDLVAAWVLDAVSDDERGAVEAHLATCTSCRREASELREAVGLLAGSTDRVEPPPSMRDAVMAAVDATPQVPAARDAGEPAAHPPRASGLAAGSVTASGSAVAGRADRPAEPDDPPPTPHPGVPPAVGRGFTRPRLQRLGLGLAAVLALVAGVLGLWSQQLQGQLQDEAERNEAIAAVLASPDATSLHHAGSALVVDVANGQAVFATSDLAAPDDGVLQLWVIDDQEVVSAGLVEDPADATLLEARVPSGGTVGVTIEPAGGSATPTSDPVVAFTT